MLQGIRQASKSYVMRAFLFVLLVGFGMWGIGDVFYSDPAERPAISVGDQEVSAGEVAFVFDRARRVFLPNSSNSEAIADGLLTQILLELTQREIFNAEADRLGLSVTRKMITTAIRLNPLFQDSSGRFSSLIMRDVLARRGISEAALADEISDSERRQQLLTAFTDGVEYPTELLRELARWQMQQRQINYATLPIDPAATPAPSESDLTLWYEDNAFAFDVPALRAATAVIFDPADFASNITISESELQAAFTDRQVSYATPELRDLRQMVFPNQAAADTAYTRLTDAGEDFADVASDMLGLATSDIIYPQATRADLLPEIADAVFTHPQGEISQPLTSPFGVHIFIVDSITPAETTSLDEVRDDLTAELLDEAAVNTVYDRISLFEDAQSLGDSLEAAAAEAGGRILTIPAISFSGRDADGNALIDISGEVRNSIWQQEVGIDGILLEDAANIFFAVRVDSETPARSRTLDEVRDEVVAAYRLQQAISQRQDQAAAVLAAEDFAAGIAEAGLTLQQSPAFDQNGTGLGPVVGLGEVADRIVETSFGLTQGESDQIQIGSDRIILIQLADIIDADPADLAGDNSTLLDDLAARHNAGLQQDITSGIIRGLQRLHDLRIRPDVVEPLLLGEEPI